MFIPEGGGVGVAGLSPRHPRVYCLSVANAAAWQVNGNGFRMVLLPTFAARKRTRHGSNKLVKAN